MNNNYLCSIDELKFSSYLDDALTNYGFFVAAASGKINDTNPIRRLYEIEQSVLNENKYDVEVYEHYSDDGINYLASVSFIKKEISL